MATNMGQREEEQRIELPPGIGFGESLGELLDDEYVPLQVPKRETHLGVAFVNMCTQSHPQFKETRIPETAVMTSLKEPYRQRDIFLGSLNYYAHIIVHLRQHILGAVDRDTDEYKLIPEIGRQDFIERARQEREAKLAASANAPEDGLMNSPEW